jgi:hypothetical protein
VAQAQRSSVEINPADAAPVTPQQAPVRPQQPLLPGGLAPVDGMRAEASSQPPVTAAPVPSQPDGPEFFQSYVHSWKRRLFLGHAYMALVGIFIFTEVSTVCVLLVQCWCSCRNVKLQHTELVSHCKS